MSRQEYEVRVTPSVLDRLIDDEPQISREPPASRQKTLQQLKQSVRRDLEWLLNSRRSIEALPDDLREVSSSVAAFGLPDFSAFSVKNPSDQNRMRRSIEEAIRLFEPRMMDVTVTLEPARDAERRVRFRIDANLRVEPAPEPVTFDTTLHLYNGEYTVQGK
jgi:type VI secretion system protein ImpF